MKRRPTVPRPLVWRATSKDDFKAFPEIVQRDMGYALFLAQQGERHPSMTRTLKGFAGGSVVEVRETGPGGAYRAVYTVRFEDAIYVLHAFQKKSHRSIATPLAEIDKVKRRLADLVEEKENSR